MIPKSEVPQTIDAYIAGVPESIQEKLQTLRQLILRMAPEATETISYQMPAFKFHGILVYFAVQKNHIGFYPTGSAIAAFSDQLTDFKTSKGTLQIPFNVPLPVSLLEQMVAFRVNEQLEKLEQKKLRAKKK